MKKIIVAISGASGFIYGYRLLKHLKNLNVETHLIISKSSELTRHYETDLKSQDVKNVADFYYSNQDLGACISSGSFRVDGMVVAPCSVKSLAEISNGIGSNLLSRSADVILKEKKPLILMVRETPFNLIHIKNMKKACEAGAIIMPPVPSLYAKPKNITEMVDYTLGRVLDFFDLELENMNRWKK